MKLNKWLCSKGLHRWGEVMQVSKYSNLLEQKCKWCSAVRCSSSDGQRWVVVPRAILEYFPRTQKKE